MRLPVLALLALLAGCFGPPLDLTPYTVCGHVADDAGLPVAGAELMANRRSRGYGTTTDDDGAFCLGGLLRGTYDLTVTKAGHADLHQDLKVAQNATLDLVLPRA